MLRILIGLVAACAALALPAAAQQKIELAIATGGTGGVYYPLGGGMANVLSRNVPGMAATAEVTGGSVANLQLIGSGKQQYIALSMTDAAQDAYKGVDKFKDNKVDVRTLMILYPNRMHVVTIEGTGISRMADLKGKRVAWVVGAPSLNQNITALLASANLTWKDVKRVDFGGFGAAMEGIISNQVDAAFSSTISGPAYKIAASPRGIQYPVLPHGDKAAWERLNKIAPFYVRGWGAEGADLSPEKKVEGATYPYPVLMSMANADAGLVYNMTKAMVELFPEYKDGAPGNVGWDIKRQIYAWAIPMHEGAIKYFKEIGTWTAEHQKHNDGLLARQKVLADAWKAYMAKAPSDDKEFAQGWMKARADALTKANMNVVLESW